MTSQTEAVGNPVYVVTEELCGDRGMQIQNRRDGRTPGEHKVRHYCLAFSLISNLYVNALRKRP
jgi:hypothetical protein